MVFTIAPAESLLFKATLCRQILVNLQFLLTVSLYAHFNGFTTYHELLIPLVYSRENYSRISGSWGGWRPFFFNNLEVD